MEDDSDPSFYSYLYDPLRDDIIKIDDYTETQFIRVYEEKKRMVLGE